MHTPGLRIIGCHPEKSTEYLIHCLDQARAMGFEGVEIIPDDFDLIVCGRICERTLSQLKAILVDYPFRISLHVPLRLNLMDREDPGLHLDVLRCCAELCGHLEARILVYHPGRYVDNIFLGRYGRPYEHIDKDNRKKLVQKEKEILSRFAPEFPELVIAMENHRPYADHSPYSYAEKINRLVDTLEDINLANVKMTLDTGHLNLAAAYYDQDPLQWIVQALPWIVHVHVHDNHGIANYYTEKDKAGMLPFGRGDEHIIPGTGTFPFTAFFRLLQQYSGIYLLELTSRYFYPARIRQGLENMNRFISQARQE